MPIAASRAPWRTNMPVTCSLCAPSARRMFCPLADRVRNGAVDARQAEQQRHDAGNRQHRERARGASQRAVVDLLQRADVGQRQVRIDRRDRLLELCLKRSRTCARRAISRADSTLSVAAVATLSSRAGTSFRAAASR
jgi:hypothetical protein